MRKILVVDDDPDILDVIEAWLHLEGYMVDTIAKADAVIPYLSNERPDVILMDIMIAGADGRTICRELKKHASHSSIPIILFSASQLQYADIMECGANDFVAKPFELNHLLHTIERQWMS